MKATDLHLNELKKQIWKLEGKYFKTSHRNVIFRSDSKGRSLLPFLTNARVNLIYRSGGSITDNNTNSFMQSYTLDRIKRTYKPLVLLLFGTCELTVKNGKFISIPEDLEGRVRDVIDKYYSYKQKILQFNPEATVIFLRLSLLFTNSVEFPERPSITRQIRIRPKEIRGSNTGIQ